MRKLTVYYCPKCRRYGYYQSENAAFCMKCSTAMSPLSIDYLHFVRLDSADRDNLIRKESLRTCTSPDLLRSRIQELEKENRQLNETVSWMHQLIWDLITKNREFERRSTAPSKHL
ncbi:MAG: hypothetical protein LIO92_09695 [Clostridiales bacterium]|nr:hypothetical protein [Clostridiales bacterium]